MATIYVYGEHCRATQGQEVSDRDLENRPGSDDFVKIEISEQEAEYYDSLKSQYGWRVAELIRERIKQDKINAGCLVEDGPVTWELEIDEDVRKLADVQIDDEWTRIDYYASGGYGNESSTGDLESAKKFVVVLVKFGLTAQTSIVFDEDEPTNEAWVLIVNTTDEDDVAFVRDAWTRFNK